MPDRGRRRRVVVRKVAAGDPTFMLQFSLTSQKEKEIPTRINFKIGADTNKLELNKEIVRTFSTNQNIRIMCSYSGSLKHVNIPANVCFSLLDEEEVAILSEAQVFYDNIKKVPATTFNLKKKQTVHFHFLDGNEDDGRDKVFLTCTPKTKKKAGNGLATRDICISSDEVNNWVIKQVKFKGCKKDKIKRYWIKNNDKYLTAVDDKSLIMTAEHSKASMWIFQEARTERFGQKISIYAIKHHINNTYLLCDTQTGKVFLKKYSMPIFPWYLHSKVKNPK